MQVSEEQDFTFKTQFELHPPVFTPKESQEEECAHTQTLVKHVFENSYGHPFVHEYKPPSCSFNRVNIDLVASVQGRQYDRLGILYLGDVEILRTSTSEPTIKGIDWRYTKEMDHYLALWKEEQTIIFDLPNIVNDVYTGPIYVTVNATFFTQQDTRQHADKILPISAQRSQSQEGSAYLVPNQRAISKHTIEGNLTKAVVSLSACGQQAEEFWYTNVLDSHAKTFEETSGELNGFSPYREVQLLIDGNVAGIALPFAVIFTGGVAPGFWRPVVGIDAYDLRQHEVDISPWIEYLSDDQDHSFEIRVVGLKQDDNGKLTLSDKVGDYWVVTGTIFLFSGGKEARTPRLAEMMPPFISNPPANVTVSSLVITDSEGRNESLAFNITVERQYNVVGFGTGLKSFGQATGFSIEGHLSAYGLNQTISQVSSGVDLVMNDGDINTFIYAYPLNLTSNITSYPLDKGFSISASLSRELRTSLAGSSVFPSGLQNWTLRDQWDPDDPISPRTEPDKIPVSGLTVHQNGSAYYRAGKEHAQSYGSLDTDLGFVAFTSSEDGMSEIFERHTETVNGGVALDMVNLHGSVGEEKGRMQGGEEIVQDSDSSEDDLLPARASLREMIGRGSGTHRKGYAPLALDVESPAPAIEL